MRPPMGPWPPYQTHWVSSWPSSTHLHPFPEPSLVKISIDPHSLGQRLSWSHWKTCSSDRTFPTTFLLLTLLAVLCHHSLFLDFGFPILFHGGTIFLYSTKEGKPFPKYPVSGFCGKPFPETSSSSSESSGLLFLLTSLNFLFHLVPYWLFPWGNEVFFQEEIFIETWGRPTEKYINCPLVDEATSYIGQGS